MTPWQRILGIAVIVLAMVMGGCSKVSPSGQQQRDPAFSPGGIKWDNIKPEGGRLKIATSALGVDRAPLIDKGVISKGIIVARRGDRLKILGFDGQLLAQGIFADPVSPSIILGMSPQGEHLFYVRDAQIPGRPQLRVIDFSNYLVLGTGCQQSYTKPDGMAVVLRVLRISHHNIRFWRDVQEGLVISFLPQTGVASSSIPVYLKLIPMRSYLRSCTCCGGGYLCDTTELCKLTYGKTNA